MEMQSERFKTANLGHAKLSKPETIVFSDDWPENLILLYVQKGL
jgi:hypothetical protein